jgi:2-C-methyl-D-erythritol 4-phosphate cytidylyltransferase/2-C-methyl-D-erythritol 2,4-cyclodiphosphate synthase
LRHAGEILGSMNASVQNLDITIICEVPKISSYRDEMKNNICEILSISPSRVNVKGKTNETLGFIGRKEGIAALATATILIQ